jgi:transposase-like protein
MGKIRRKFETEFKRQLIAQIEAGQTTIGQAARDHQISRSVIERWRVQYRNNGLVDRPSSRERQLEAENEKLRAKVGELVMQMDYLKNCKPGFSSGKTPIHRSSPPRTGINFESLPSSWPTLQHVLLQTKQTASKAS